MTVVDEGNKGLMVMEMSAVDMCMVVEYYLNEVMLKNPVYVKSVVKIAAQIGNLTFRIETVPMPSELDSSVRGTDTGTPMVDSILAAGEDVDG